MIPSITQLCRRARWAGVSPVCIWGTAVCVLCGPICFSLKGSSWLLQCHMHAGKEGSPLGELGLGAAEGVAWAVRSDVQGAHNGEAGVLAVAAAVLVGAGAGVAGGSRGWAHQRVGEHQQGAGQGLAFPRCASEGA